MKIIIGKISNPINNVDKEFKELLDLLENTGYELAWDNYPYTVSVIKQVAEIQNEGE